MMVRNLWIKLCHLPWDGMWSDSALNEQQVNVE